MCFWQQVSSGGEEKESRGKPKEQSQTFRGHARPNQACLASMHFSTVPQESQDLGTRQDPVQSPPGNNQQQVIVLTAHHSECVDGRSIRSNYAEVAGWHYTLHASLQPLATRDFLNLVWCDEPD